MYCRECGVKMPENAKFCVECGCRAEIPLSSEEAETANDSYTPDTDERYDAQKSYETEEITGEYEAFEDEYYQDEYYEDDGEYEVKRKSGKGFLIFIITVLILGCCAFGALLYFDSSEESEEAIAFTEGILKDIEDGDFVGITYSMPTKAVNAILEKKGYDSRQRLAEDFEDALSDEDSVFNTSNYRHQTVGAAEYDKDKIRFDTGRLEQGLGIRLGEVQTIVSVEVKFVNIRDSSDVRYRNFIVGYTEGTWRLLDMVSYSESNFGWNEILGEQ